MVQRWREEGQPLDETVRHPFKPWAETIGGILKVNGYKEFLTNYAIRKTADDPVREALGLLGIEQPDRWERPGFWSKAAADLGLVKKLISEADRESEKSRERGIGVTFSNHEDETFEIVTDQATTVLRLMKKRARFGESEPHLRYKFEKVKEEQVPCEDAGEPTNPNE